MLEFLPYNIIGVIDEEFIFGGIQRIYLDEIWRLIGVTSNKEVASFIYKIFKTIRKYGGSGVAITQDVSDQQGFCTEQKENTDLKVMLGYKGFTKTSSKWVEWQHSKICPCPDSQNMYYLI